MKLVEKLDPAEVRQPSREEIADFAIGLAREDWHWGGVAPRLQELFYWPSWAAPCRDERKLLLPLVEALKKKAEETLRHHYAYYHALAVRRRRWLRAHPQARVRGWAAKPLRPGRASAIPRKPILRPPPGRLRFPAAASPPAAARPQGLPNRPGRWKREILLCFDWLFDNRIAVYARAA